MFVWENKGGIFEPTGRAEGRDVHNMARVYEHVAAAHAEAPALRFGPSHVVTHGELNALSNRMARWLQQSGVGKGDVVGILSEKVPQAYACLIACLKLGAVYTVFDDDIVIERFRKKLSRARPRVLFTDSECAPEVVSACGECGTDILVAGEGRLLELLDRFDADDLPETRMVTGADPAYIMFTSGSTGVPKGAIITHGNLINFRNWTIDRFGSSPADVFTGLNPMYFDNSVFDFYASVFTGASLAPFSGETVQDAGGLVSRVDEVGCTVWFSVPSLLIYLSTMKALQADNLQSIRSFVFGGEGFPKSELKKLFDLYGRRASFVNVYGPTECTCICSAYDVSAEDLEDPHGLPPLGVIAEDFSYLLLDEDDGRVEPGEAGELCLMGPNVGLGYYGDPEQTRRTFSTDPYNDEHPARMYRTGDLVRLDPDDGYLHFVGRKDNQIKHMGYRIELEEIEAALNGLEYIGESIAIYQRSKARYGQLIAVVGASSEASQAGIKEAEIKKDLAPLIPAYMIPSRIVIEAELPKNRSGKVDRRALVERFSTR